MKKFLIWIFVSLLLAVNSMAQVSVNADGSQGDASAMLDVASTSKGVLVPRMTSTQRINISNPANGLLVFDETTSSFWFYSSSNWIEFSSGNNIVEEIADLSDANSDNSNVFIGENSGNSNAGTDNSAFGINSLNSNTTGSSNIALGYASLYNNTSGNNNVALGHQSLYNNQGGNNNTALGYMAGYGSSLQSNSGNVFLGYKAGYFESGNNKLYIENSDSNTPLIGGDFLEDTLAIAGDLNVNGNIKLTGGIPGEDKILISDTEGLTSWVDKIDLFEINDLSDGLTQNRSSTFLGNNAGNNSSNTHNTSLGNNTLNNVLINGVSNVALGSDALRYATTGDYNIALGSSSLKQLTAGNNNVALGYYSGKYLTTGETNVDIGSYSNINTSNKINFIRPTTYLYGDLFTYLFAGDFETKYVHFFGHLKVYDTLFLSDEPIVGGCVKLYHDYGINDPNRYTTDWELNTIPFCSLSDVDCGDYSYSIGNTSPADSNSIVYGALAMQNSTSDGINNVVLGTAAMAYSQKADSNVVIGSYAGYGNGSLHNSLGNIFIGYKAGYQELGDNKLYIENSDSDTPLLGGDFSVDSISIAGDLSVYGNLKISGGNPSEGKILTTDNDGNASWDDLNSLNIEINDLNEGKTDNTSLFIGYRTGSSDDGTNFNTALGGLSANKNTSGLYNTSFGYYSLYSNISGDKNVAIGNEALKANLSNNNTAIGYQASNAITTYSNSTAVGYNAQATASNRIRFGDNNILSIGGYQNWTNLSDKRYKSNIQENVPGLDFILKLRPVTYHLDIIKLNKFQNIEISSNDEESISQQEKIRYTGFIAQEVEKIAQEIGYDFSGLKRPQHRRDTYALSYEEFVVPLVKAMQERQQQIENQQTQIQNIQNKLKLLKQLINEE